MLARLRNRNYTYEFAQTLTTFHEFCILKSSDKNFVISDQLLASAALSFKARFANATNRTIGMKNVIVLLPMSKSYYLRFYNGNKRYYIRPNQMIYLTPEQIDEINQVIMNNSYMQTAGPCQESLKRILKNYRQSWPTAIYYGGNNIIGGVELRKEVFFYKEDEIIYDFAETPVEFSRYVGIKKNDPCPCGRGEIFRNCCRYKVRAFNKFIKNVELQSKNPNFDPYSIPRCKFREMNIFEYCTRVFNNP